MVKVTRNPPMPGEPETPTAQIIRASQETAEVTDALGRRIVARRITALQRMRIIRVIGKDAGNPQYLGYALLAASCASIDGELEPIPVSIPQVEAMVDRLGDDGLTAIAEAAQRAGWVTDDTEEGGVEADAKNS
jgi:hypothetical protein